MQKKSFSWGIVAFVFIFFFPAGIFMILWKMRAEKLFYKQNGKALQVFGGVLFGMGLLFLFMAITQGVTTEDGQSALGGIVCMIFLLCGGGALMIVRGKHYVKLGRKFSRYIAIIGADDNPSIDHIADIYPTTYEETAADLQKMLDAGFFYNAYIDLNKRVFVMPGRKSTSVRRVSVRVRESAETVKFVEPTTHAVKCPNCGASNTVTSGEANECEYCGSPI